MVGVIAWRTEEAEERAWEHQTSEPRGSQDPEDIAGPWRTLQQNVDTGRGEEAVWVSLGPLVNPGSLAQEIQDRMKGDLQQTWRHNVDSVSAARGIGSRN